MPQGKQFYLLSVLLGCFVIASASTGEVLASEDGECDAVLKYAGRQRLHFASKEQFIQWTEQSSEYQKYSSAGGNYGGIGATYSSDDYKSSDNKDYLAWEKMVFAEIDSVFEPAVAAWLSCKKSKFTIIGFPRADESGFLAEIRTSGLIPNILLEAVDYRSDLATCKNKGSTINPNQPLNHNLGQGYFLLSCSRNRGTSAPILVDVFTNNESRTLVIPVSPLVSDFKVGDPRNISKTISGCRSTVYLPAVGYDREFNLKSLTLSGSGARTELFFYANGDQVGYVEGREKNSADVTWPFPRIDSYFKINAGIPVQFRTDFKNYSSVRPGCTDISAEISYTPL